MLFHASPRGLVILSHNALQFYEVKTAKLVTVSFPPTVVDHLDILDKPGLDTLITTALAQSPLKNAMVCMLLLTDDVIFSKMIPSGAADQMAKLQAEFLNSLPFESQQIASMQVNQPTGTILFATNRDLLIALSNIFAKKQWTITKVLPYTLVSTVAANQPLTVQNLTAIMDNADKQKDASLLNLGDKPAEPTVAQPVGGAIPTTPSAAPKKSNKMVFILLALVLLIILGLGGAQWFGVLSLPFLPSKSASNTPKATDLPQEGTSSASLVSPSSSASASASPSATKKADLTVAVLNGSGKTGQASTIKSILEESGFANITVGNKTPVPNTPSQLITNSDVSPAVITELKSILADQLPGLEAVSSPSATTNIQVITGTK